MPYTTPETLEIGDHVWYDMQHGNPEYLGSLQAMSHDGKTAYVKYKYGFASYPVDKIIIEVDEKSQEEL